jgi:hypothetical protein
MSEDEIAYGREIIAHYVKRGQEYTEILARAKRYGSTGTSGSLPHSDHEPS